MSIRSGLLLRVHCLCVFATFRHWRPDAPRICLMAQAEQSRKAKRQRVLAKVAAVSKTTDSALARVLASLSEEGILDAEAAGDCNNLRREISSGIAAHNKADTPYGRVVQTLQVTPEFACPFVNPFAIMWHLCTLSAAFADLVRCHLTQRCCRVVMYADELRPGNVLRPDRGRQVWGIYWTWLEWPSSVRQQETGRLVACTLRTVELHQVIRAILHVFWSCDAFNFQTTGIRCPRPLGPVHLRGTLAGILADEKGLKDMFCVKRGFRHKALPHVHEHCGAAGSTPAPVFENADGSKQCRVRLAQRPILPEYG